MKHLVSFKKSDARGIGTQVNCKTGKVVPIFVHKVFLMLFKYKLLTGHKG